MIKSHTQGTLFCCALLAAISGCSAEVANDDVALSGESLSSCAPSVPPAIAVPEGQRLELFADAEGVQIYTCKADSNGTLGWVFKEPRADLFNGRGKVIIHHYGGPTWEAHDGSKVVGTKLAAFTADASAIPWLLLQATSHEGSGRMQNVSYIQRLDTAGGLAPTTACTVADETAEVPYTATYYFYVPKHPGKSR